MAEEEYQAAAAQTAQLAAQLPKIGVVGRRPPQGPSMPQRLINHFRSPKAVLGQMLLLQIRIVLAKRCVMLLTLERCAALLTFELCAVLLAFDFGAVLLTLELCTVLLMFSSDL